MTTPKKSPTRSRGRRAPSKRTAIRKRPADAGDGPRADAVTATPVPDDVERIPVAESIAEPVLEATPRADVTAEPEPSFASPEPLFVARVPPVEPERPAPAVRRAIFFDVENTSRAEHVARVLGHLAVDRVGQRVDFVAVGNWRVIGHDTARLLSRHGASLVHSAPSTGVKDWSDLRIAVAAGVWLASARAGDVVEVVSDDRAFDAVGDVAASLGIVFRRLSFRGLAGVPGPPPAAEMEEEARAAPRRPSDGARRRSRGRGRGRGRGAHHGAAPVHRPPAPAAPHAAAPAPHAPARHARDERVTAPHAEAHTAPHDEIVAVVRDLIGAASGRGITIDALANTLKARGFSRPPGSPRLITRLRRIRELGVDRAGLITLLDAAAPAAAAEARPHAAAETSPAPAAVSPDRSAAEDRPGGEPTEADQEALAEDATAEAPRRGRRRSRGGRRRRRGGGGGRRHAAPAAAST